MRPTMSETSSYLATGVAEAVTPYGADGSGAPHTKLSISLPSDLVAVIRQVSEQTGLTMSATIGACVRRTLALVEQERLDRALELDAEENLAWAGAHLPAAARLWESIEW